MIVTFLGTGTSQGVPVIACQCRVCQSMDFHDKRLRSSIHLQIENRSFIIDTGPDFRQQVLREKISKVDALVFTHEHKDHTAGLDDVRGFNFVQKMDMPLYARSNVIGQLKTEFAYAFNDNKYPGVPRLEVHAIDNSPFDIQGIRFIPIEVLHLKLPVFGYRIEDFTYITDANHISDREMGKIAGTKVLVINALQQQPHVSHFNLEQALEVIAKIGPAQAYLTHISHRMGRHREVADMLPENVHVAYDGLKITI